MNKISKPDAQNLLTCLDGDKNMPLHGAIQFGNFFAAKVCLVNGSSIDETDNKYNNSAVHMAAVLGSMELLYLFKDSQPDTFFKMVLNSTKLLNFFIKLIKVLSCASSTRKTPVVRRLSTRLPSQITLP